MKIKDRYFLANVGIPTIPSYKFRGSENRIPSLGVGVGNATAKDSPVYTGDKMLGVSQLHKSNAVPVFSNEEIINISHMRR